MWEMKRLAWSLALAVLVAGTAVQLPGTDRAAAAAPASCGLTTLDGTIDLSQEAHDSGKPLKCARGEPLVVRERLQNAKDGRARRRTPLLTVVTIADVQLADEESPGRAEWADKCEEHPATAAFRPHETMVPHLLNAHLRAANAIVAKGGPVLGDDFSYGIALGDLADNMQFNEIRWIIDLIDGKQLVDPDSGKDDAIASGADGYDGVQREDPPGAPADPMTSPVEGERILDLANEPFWAVGLRPQGRPLPWYTLPGNHDVKVQGNVANEEAWLQFINTYNQGHSKVNETMSPEDQQRACGGDSSDPAFYESIVTNPGVSQPVPADDRRRIVRRQEWVDEHFTTTGVPKGHGYNRNRCKDDAGELLVRACYSWVDGKFHFISLDSNPDEVESSGNIDDPQFQWLEKQLISSSKTYYDADGQKVSNPDGTNRLIVVYAHHPVTSMTNPATPGAHLGPDFKQLLLRFPNVVVNANGHTHQNKLWPRRNKELGTAYWEVNTSAVVDFPTQSRTLEIADNHDGTLSIFSVVFNAMVSPDPRDIDWLTGDQTSEVSLGGAERDINEDWLASFGQEVLFYDPQQDLTKIGKPRHRNVELLLKAPRWLSN
jgi:metallophosphoesterase (TIGR03767 family)